MTDRYVFGRLSRREPSASPLELLTGAQGSSKQMQYTILFHRSSKIVDERVLSARSFSRLSKTSPLGVPCSQVIELVVLS